MNYVYIANWKMNLSFQQSINFCTVNSDALQQLATTADIILCPSFDALAPVTQILKHTDIAIGAQNCSEHKSGAYTGEVSAQSLAEIGAKYCIVGHSEQRMYHHETTENIIKKIELLCINNITPIICIGETQQEFETNQTFTVLTEQLKPILNVTCPPKLVIAYEPIWSIGTGIIPEQKQLIAVFEWLAQQVHTSTQLLYGGSVNQDNIAELKKLPPINGFLIGGASADFEQLKKIISL
jgi:triosephosphate isomerase (TIM)